LTKTIKKTIKKYKNFKDTYKYAYVGFPKGFAGIKKAFFGSFDEFNKKYPNAKEERVFPTLLYMHGSSGLYRGEVYRKYIVEELGFIFFAVDNKNIFLMGNSEGGLAVAIYKASSFNGRIVTAFSCESSYFYKNFKLGSKKDKPFLNIIGTHDEFFAKGTVLNKKYKVKGNGIERLKNYKNAKVVILPKAKHDLTTNIYVKDEILNFLKLWSRE
jgi:hypothetical protein